ncbi:hypothetical protein SAMN04487926_117162 [Paraburkholderia steynii]|uniref:Uncharacterized protein n=1 Tax=Paraburkholderia steynii TaxID=1245441 RepID=A0A7Z7FJ52_9BURK|nr:hypothetical protein SAMN04487926_117162 [Paraburkholderia steynii]
MWPLYREDRGPVWGTKFCWFTRLLLVVVVTVRNANDAVRFDIAYFSALDRAHSPVGTLPPPVFFNVSAILLPLLAVMICP